MWEGEDESEKARGEFMWVQISSGEWKPVCTLEFNRESFITCQSAMIDWKKESKLHIPNIWKDP